MSDECGVMSSSCLPLITPHSSLESSTAHMYATPLLAAFAWPQLACVAIWSGLVVLTVALPILMRSQWGKAQPLRRCMVLSVWAHVLLAAFATTVPVVRNLGPPGPGNGDGVMHVRMLSDAELAMLDAAASAASESTLAESVPETVPEQPAPIEPEPPVVEPATIEPIPIEAPRATESPAEPQPAAPAFPPEAPEITQSPFDRAPEPPAESIAEPTFTSVQTPEVSPPVADDAQDLVDVSAPPAAAPAITATSTPATTVPREYQWRRSADKTAIASAGGGSADTELAVKAALAWLASAQSRDGRWDADQFGAGRGSGQDATRAGAGIEADTGVTGLALLTFLAAGHTHQEGAYQDTVGRGLRFILSSQAENGNLSGNADVFASMYCHGMAGVALAEAYGMTADQELKRPVERAVMYTLAAQHPSSGGWRYRPGDLGDTSQLGWQLMLLRSARIAGLKVPNDPFEGAKVFLRYVSAGQHGGLASYRFNEQISSPMTAEALACRQFLGTMPDAPAALEASQRLLTELPGQGGDNYYYWYYGTLAMHQMGGEYWTTWNRALQTRLLSTQTPDGRFAGSWNPDSIWGGYGGRIYSTALATLSLEVYYRYLPMVNETAAKSRHIK